MNSDGPGALSGAGSEPGSDTAVWERQIGQAAVALCEAVMEREVSGDLAATPETAAVIEAAIRIVVHDEVERGDFLDQALALAEEIVAQNRPALEALHRAGGGFVFRTLETWPDCLANRPLQPLPSAGAGPAGETTRRISDYEARSLHQAAHGFVGALLTNEPMTVAFGRFRLTPSRADCPPDVLVRVLLAGAIVDELVEAPRSKCPCAQMAMEEIALACGVSAHARHTIGESVQRAGKTTEAHHRFIASWEAMGPIVRDALRRGRLEMIAADLRRSGAVTVAPTPDDALPADNAAGATRYPPSASKSKWP
jgi:hypothetical protein